MTKVLPLEKMHYPEVKKIYEQGITTGQATFETAGPEFDSWDQTHLSHSRIVAIENSQVIGWAALSGVSGRCVYAGVAEVSVYISPEHTRKGIGKLLMEKLINESEKNGIWTLQAGMFPENEAS